MAIAKGILSFDFTCLEDLSTILCDGPWPSGCSTLVLLKWTSILNMKESFFERAPIWVRLPELPLEFWNEEVFVGVASSFGELLSINLTTASKRHLTYAHICIGVVEGVDMLEYVSFHSKLGVHKQKMIYKMILFAYFNCLKYGHKANKCPNPKADKKMKPFASSSGKVSSGKDKKKV